MSNSLNQRAFAVAECVVQNVEQLRISRNEVDAAGRILDFGIDAAGGLAAGLELARICMSDRGGISLVPGELGSSRWPYVQVICDWPLEACLLSQYAGWQIQVDDYVAMGSGPMRAAAAVEKLYKRFEYRETPLQIVGVLEADRLPNRSVFEYIAAKTEVDPSQIVLCAAPTSSQAGNLQVVARSIETAMHKLLEIGFDVRRICSGHGTAPLPPVAADDLTGIGWTNDAILYGAQVTLWVNGDDESLAEIGSKVPSSASACYGKPFLEIFEDAGRDFYQIDPGLFSPAEITFQNLDTGRVHRFGRICPEIIHRSFGI